MVGSVMHSQCYPTWAQLVTEITLMPRMCNMLCLHVVRHVGFDLAPVPTDHTSPAILAVATGSVHVPSDFSLYRL